MKFSHTIKLNATPEWQRYYLDYSHLKKLIYAIEHEPSTESTNAFFNSLDAELDKIRQFILKTTQQLVQRVETVNDKESIEVLYVGINNLMNYITQNHTGEF